MDNSVVLYTVQNWCYGISTFFRGIMRYRMGKEANETPISSDYIHLTINQMSVLGGDRAENMAVKTHCAICTKG